MKCQNRRFTKFISLLKFPGLQYCDLVSDVFCVICTILERGSRFYAINKSAKLRKILKIMKTRCPARGLPFPSLCMGSTLTNANGKSAAVRSTGQACASLVALETVARVTTIRDYVSKSVSAVAIGESVVRDTRIWADDGWVEVE